MAAARAALLSTSVALLYAASRQVGHSSAPAPPYTVLGPLSLSAPSQEFHSSDARTHRLSRQTETERRRTDEVVGESIVRDIMEELGQQLAG